MAGDSCLSYCQTCPARAVTSCDHVEDVSIRCSKYTTIICYVSVSFLGYLTSVTANTVVINGCLNTTRIPSTLHLNIYSIINYILASPQSGSLILTRNGAFSKSYTSGRVVVYGVGTTTSSNSWGNVCRLSSFGITEANVICHQLTFTGASSWSYAAIDSLVAIFVSNLFLYSLSFGVDFRPVLIDEVSCLNDYLTLLQCNVRVNPVSSSCTNSDDVSVTCCKSK